ncbi:MAG: tRNA (adenosine(37)-N6)-threonylcarbamoyltransferase complex ATPase subunit type 1 TsaE [Clostridia bacterium]|nr:tRNA (adenosine(37)-N6)-threonylcarbamoyltransferase complex ATPase subunit type 1 TsaE [Clostridia bacterium]
MKEFHSSSDSETIKIAAEFAKTLPRGAVVCLFGEMGVGKTVFTNGLCRALGVKEYVTSPTFTVVNEYDGAAFPVYHFDMYRLESEDELLEIGFDEYLNSGGICIIEWPENVLNSLPKKRIDVKILRGKEYCERTIIIKD